MIKENLIPYDELMELRSKGFINYSPNSEKEHSGSVYYYENGKLYYDPWPMYSSSAHAGQIIAATVDQAKEFLNQNK